MQSIRNLDKAAQRKAFKKIVRAFEIFCKQEFGFDLYDYQRRIATACLSAILIEPKNIFIKVSRQSGKTEVVTLILKFLTIFHFLFVGTPLMAGIASPKGEQAKTDLDRLKKSVAAMRERWQVEDREFNAHTIRAYRNDVLYAEVFKFSLAPTTTNESKTLNLLIVEEAHKTDDEKRRDQLDPMTSSTGGITIFIGVGCTRTCDFKRGCDGELPNSEVIVCPVDDVIRDRRKKYDETGDPAHLEYEKSFKRTVRLVGSQNPEIRRNFYLEDTIEEGNFVSRERLLSCARPKGAKLDLSVLGLGIDWARRSDSTWAALATPQNDIADMLKLPHVAYEQQVELIDAWVNEKRTEEVTKPDGTTETIEFTYLDRIMAVRGDSTGSAGDAPMELLASKTRLPVGEESHFVFGMQSKSRLYSDFETAIFKEEGDPLRFSYPADHPLSAEFEEQMVELEREYLGEGEYLSVHHPDEAGAKDDGPDAGALALLAAANVSVGEILVL